MNGLNMTPITDFDPLKMLQDLQQGFQLLADNQRILNDNQTQLTQANDALVQAMQNLQRRQDILKEVLDLVILAQKTIETDLHK
jgi:hypothetical protein